jgi:hypothetical protein
MHNRRYLLFLILTVVLLAVIVGGSDSVFAQARFRINILDGPGEGFNDISAPDHDSTLGRNSGATLGDQRRIAFDHAVNIWAGLLDSSVTIVVDATFDTLPCNATATTIGVAGTNTIHANFTGAPVLDTWYPAALANSLAGTDLNPATSDIDAVFNSRLDGACAFPKVWYYGLDGNPPAGTLDFISAVLHEMAHGLGFQTFMDPATGEKLSGLYDAFLLWLADVSTGVLLSDMPLNADRVAASINTGNLRWVGPDVTAASTVLTSGRSVDGYVEMYAPDPVEAGSSVSHFSTSLSPNQLMEPSLTGAKHDVGLALEVMQDIGWSTRAPAPAAARSGGGGCFIGAITGF